MSQIILIYPKLTRENDPAALMMPLSLIYVAQPLRTNGYSVTILDQRVAPDWPAKLRQELSRGEAICVGISAMTGLQIEGGILAAKIVREYSGDLPIVWGGVHASLLPEETVEDEHVDIVVIGEGERTFLELVRKLEAHESPSTINGLCLKEDGKPVRTHPQTHMDLHEIEVSRLPYELLESVDQYLTNPLGHLPGAEKRSVAFLTSRGCPHRCTYCYNVEFSHRRWRAYEPEIVVRDLKYVTEKFGSRGVFLLDDNFFTNLRRVEKICELIIKNDISVRFYNVNCRLNTLAEADMDFLRLMRRAGIHNLFIGIESASPRVLKAMKKDVSIEHIFRVDRKLRSANIVATYSFMIGLPVEDVDDIKETLVLMCEIIGENPDAGISAQLYLPLPGSEMFDNCVRKGLVGPQTLSEWAHFSENHVLHNLEGCSWFNKKDKRFLRKAVIMMQVIDTKMNQRSTPTKEFLRRMYSNIVRLRIKNDFYGFMPELHLRDVEFLRLREKRGSRARAES